MGLISGLNDTVSKGRFEPGPEMSVRAIRTLPRRWSLVTPAEAGGQSSLGSGYRRNDEIGHYASDFTGFASGLSALKEMRSAWMSVPVQ